MSSNKLQVIRASYGKVGPTSVSDSSIAMTKKIQNRIGPRGSKKTVLWGLKTVSRKSNRGDGAQNVKFSSIFPRMSF